MLEIPLVPAQRIEVPKWLQVRGLLLPGGGVRMGQVGLEGARGLEGGPTGAAEGLCVGYGQGGHAQVSVLTCWTCRVTPSRRARPAAFGSAQDTGSWLTRHQWASELGLQAWWAGRRVWPSDNSSRGPAQLMGSGEGYPACPCPCPGQRGRIAEWLGGLGSSPAVWSGQPRPH